MSDGVLTLRKGEAVPDIPLTIKDEAGVPLDLTGGTMTVKLEKASPGGSQDILAVAVTLSCGKIKFTLTVAELNGLKEGKKQDFYVEINKAAGDIRLAKFANALTVEKALFT